MNITMVPSSSNQNSCLAYPKFLLPGQLSFHLHRHRLDFLLQLLYLLGMVFI